MGRSSKLALVTLLTGLLSLTSVALQSPAVRAYEPCDQQTENRCAMTMPPANESIVYHFEAVSPTHILSGNGTGQEHFEAVSTGQPEPYLVPHSDSVTVQAADKDGQVRAQGIIPPAQTAEPCVIYRVADSVYYTPLIGNTWAIYDRQPDGIFVIEGSVSGPPPADGIALTM